MIFLDLPFTERLRQLTAAGFEVEIWDWTRHDIGEGNLIELIRRAGPLIGEIQVALPLRLHPEPRATRHAPRAIA